MPRLPAASLRTAHRSASCSSPVDLWGSALFAAVLQVTSWPDARGINEMCEAVALLPQKTCATSVRLEIQFAHVSILRSPNVVAVGGTCFNLK